MELLVQGSNMVPAAELPIQFPINAPGKTGEDGQIAWTPAFMGDPEEAPVSWLYSGPALATVAIWE